MWGWNYLQNGTFLWKCCKVERAATGSGVCGYFESGDLFIMQPHSALGYESNWIWRRSVYNAASPARAEVCFGAVPPFPVCVMPLCTVWHYVCVLALCTMWSLCGTMWRLSGTMWKLTTPLGGLQHFLLSVDDWNQLATSPLLPLSDEAEVGKAIVRAETGILQTPTPEPSLVCKS